MKKIFKTIIALVPFKQAIYTFVRAIIRPSERIYRHLHFKGEIELRVSKQESFKMYHYGYQLENDLFWSGLQNGWEKESINLWINLSKRSTVILDIGANTGLFSLLAKAVQPHAKIYSFEPVERVFDKLVNNIERNAFDIVPIRKALSNKNGTALIYDQPTEHVYSVTVNQNLSDTGLETIPVKIEIETLAHFIESNNLTQIDLLKIDVETHEPEVLEGMGIYLKKFRPPMLIELLTDEVAARVEALIKDLDYLYFNIDEHSGITRTHQLTKSASFNFLLCDIEMATQLNLV